MGFFSGFKPLSIVGSAIGEAFAGPVGLVAGKKAGNFLNDLLNPPKPPDLQSPTALSQQPTLADAAPVGAAATLQSEKSASSTSQFLSGGGGLLDEPTTTSRTLIGS